MSGFMSKFPTQFTPTPKQKLELLEALRDKLREIREAKDLETKTEKLTTNHV